MQDLLDQMSARVLRHTKGLRTETDLPRVAIGTMWQHSVPVASACGPGVCLVLQGAKQMLIGGSMLRYGAGSCFASIIELPTTRCAFETNNDKPYVATSLKLDHDLCHALVADLRPVEKFKSTPGFNIAPVSRDLLEAWDRHLALLDTPEDIPVLAAIRERELVYRLLQSAHGPLLRQIALVDGKLGQIRRAIEWMRQNYREPISVRTLAEHAGMSVQSFNRHFRTATSTSPLQYQKTLRLQAARRMLAARTEAARAAYAVGYESASQFSREYTRLFGRPPKQDGSALRENMELSSIMI